MASTPATISSTTYVRDAATHVSTSKVTPPPRPRFDRSLRKLAEWVSVCADGATNCPSSASRTSNKKRTAITTFPCAIAPPANGSDTLNRRRRLKAPQAIRLARLQTPTPSFPSSSHPEEEPVIVPPGGEGDGPGGIDDFTTISPPSKTCSQVSTASTVTDWMTFAQDSWNTETAAIGAETLAWLGYFDVFCPASKRPYVDLEATPTEIPVPASIEPALTPKPSPYAEGTCRVSVQLDQWSKHKMTVIQTIDFWAQRSGCILRKFIQRSLSIVE